MSTNFDAPTPMQALTVGNVVSAAVRLYRSHLKSYFLLALIASLWILLPLLFLIPAVITLSFSLTAGNNTAFIWIIVLLLGIGVLLYSMGKYAVNTAIISRLVFAELINQPETVTQARSQVAPKLWRFVVLSLLMLLIGMGIGLGFVIFLGIFMAIMFAAFGRNPVLIPLVTGLIFLAAFPFFMWLSSRLSVVDIPLAIEENLDATGSLSRGWQLTKGKAWRIILILLVTFLITIPIQIVTQLLSNLLEAAFFNPAIIREAGNGSTAASTSLIIGYLLLFTMVYLLNSVVLPIWQAIKGVIYYDLRTRQEGLDLRLRDRGI